MFFSNSVYQKVMGGNQGLSKAGIFAAFKTKLRLFL
jgi:hypothetical protein